MSSPRSASTVSSMPRPLRSSSARMPFAGPSLNTTSRTPHSASGSPQRLRSSKSSDFFIQISSPARVFSLQLL